MVIILLEMLNDFDCSFSLCYERRTAKYQHYMLSIMVACRCQYGLALNSHQVWFNNVAISNSNEVINIKMELAFDDIAFALCATARALGHAYALAHFDLNIYPLDLLVSFGEFRHQTSMCVIVCMCVSIAL